MDLFSVVVRLGNLLHGADVNSIVEVWCVVPCEPKQIRSHNFVHSYPTDETTKRIRASRENLEYQYNPFV